MSRIAWSRYAGEEIEQAIAMFIAAEHPRAVRIRPSQGDGGIDILDQGERTVVYQVKGFHQNFTSGQWKQIEGSIDRLTTDPRWKSLTVDEWHLVVPINPTPEALDRLQKYATGRGLPEPHWDGLERCDIWASNHPRTVDYFFNGSRDDIVRTATALLQLQPGDRQATVELPNAEVAAHELNEMVKFLNAQDPFYSYGISATPAIWGDQRDVDRAFSEHQVVRSDLVMRLSRADRDTVLIIDVFAKTALSTELRPIAGSFTVTAKVGSPEHDALRHWFKYGSPLELPMGSVDGEFHGIEGLGNPVEGAALRVLPGAIPDDAPTHLRLVIFAPDGAEVGCVMMRRTYLTAGTGLGSNPGMETTFVDQFQRLKIILRWDDSGPSMSMSTSSLEGLPADQVKELSTAILAMRQGGNSFTIAPQFGPLPSERNPVTPADAQELAALMLQAELADALKRLQGYTSTPLQFPQTRILGSQIRCAAFWPRGLC